ncbi:MAG: HNH endonuclease [Desulfovibrionaceae bacterium]|nr:HNH endonuclease [Desulfovibrionaceae bacterium]MBF0513652.1 HNH endonuclease [Desulfovibrionaceae bacterium]
MKKTILSILALMLAASVALAGDLPDRSLTPGAIASTDISEVCRPGYAKAHRHTPAALKERVYAAYGITRHEPGEYEVDHDVPLCLGGADEFENLWPQSYWTEPWNAHKKDRLEVYVLKLVCKDRTLSLEDGQKIFLGNWIEAYKRFFGDDVNPGRAPRGRKPQ